MKIGIVGPEDSVKDALEVARKNQSYLELFPVVYKDYREAVALVETFQNDYDGLLFTGVNVFTYTSSKLKVTVPWEYISCTSAELSCAILMAASFKGCDITRMSFDATYPVLEAYNGIGIEAERVNYYVADEMRILDDDYPEYLYEFHRSLYESKQTTCAIVGVRSVYERLVESNIPCLRRRRYPDSLLEKLTKLRLRHQIRESGSHMVVALDAMLQEDHSIYGKSELDAIQKSSKVAESVYFFAQSLDGAMVAGQRGKYYVFCDKVITVSEEKNLKDFKVFLRILSSKVAKKLFVGIGLGKSIYSAKCNADLGLERARLTGSDCLFWVYPDERVLGPISLRAEHIPVENPDPRLYAISSATGLGIRSLYKLQQILKQYSVDIVTPNELAKLYGISRRSMNRILVKLEDGGYLKIIGKEDKRQSGRPSRQIQIML